jgi:hypothetical protein
MPGKSHHHVEDACLVGNTLVIGYGDSTKCVDTQIDTLNLNEFVNKNVPFLSTSFARGLTRITCRAGHFFETPCFTLRILIGGSALWRLSIIGVSYLAVTTNEFTCGRSPMIPQSRRMT